MNYATKLNETQAADISTLDNIQKTQHAYYDASLNQIFRNFDKHMTDSSIELASKVEIGEYTEIQDKLVLNASADIYDTQVVLQSNDSKEELVFEVFKRDIDKTEEVYIPIRVSDVYINGDDGQTSVKDVLIGNGTSLANLDSWSKVINASVNTNELEITKRAYDASLNDVSIHLNKLQSDYDKVIQDGVVHSAGSVYVNNDKVMLATSPGTGTLYVYDGQSQNILTDVKAKNVIIYPSGNEDSGIIDLTLVHDNLQDTMTELENVEKNLTTMQENYIDPVISVQGATYLVTANCMSADVYVETPSMRIRSGGNVGYYTMTGDEDKITFSYVDNAGNGRQGSIGVRNLTFKPTDGVDKTLVDFYSEFTKLRQEVSDLKPDTSSGDGDVTETVNSLIVTNKLTIGTNTTGKSEISYNQTSNVLDVNSKLNA